MVGIPPPPQKQGHPLDLGILLFQNDSPFPFSTPPNLDSLTVISQPERTGSYSSTVPWPGPGGLHTTFVLIIMMMMTVKIMFMMMMIPVTMMMMTVRIMVMMMMITVP